MRIVRIGLDAAPGVLPALADFYGQRLALDVARRGGSLLVGAGATEIVFDAAPDGAEPFYHFALRVPRDRFDAARSWAEQRAGLLADHDTGRTTFRFDSWNADACYFEDPAGNIVELIAHHELPEESDAAGPFDGRELIGVCEVGVVVSDIAAAARPLIDAGVELWDGTLDRPDGLAFMGGRDGVLILSREGRPWMPTTRSARRHRVEVATGAPERVRVALDDAGRVGVTLR